LRTACASKIPVWIAGVRSYLNLAVCFYSGSNVTSIAEDEIMRILILMRNFITGYKQVSESDFLSHEAMQSCLGLTVGRMVGDLLRLEHNRLCGRSLPMTLTEAGLVENLGWIGSTRVS
jgi:hypothetical protein